MSSDDAAAFDRTPSDDDAAMDEDDDDDHEAEDVGQDCGDGAVDDPGKGVQKYFESMPLLNAYDVVLLLPLPQRHSDAKPDNGNPTLFATGM